MLRMLIVECHFWCNGKDCAEERGGRGTGSEVLMHAAEYGLLGDCLRTSMSVYDRLCGAVRMSGRIKPVIKSFPTQETVVSNHVVSCEHTGD